MKANQYLVKYIGIMFPSISLAAAYAKINRTTLGKAINVAFNKLETTSDTPRITITTKGLSFEVTKFNY
tara:strand:- start:2674 stop:2880 length:207 start_codon:yes stop_codon:yes gene_type:complete